MEAKDGQIVTFALDGSNFVLVVDPNKDGQALLRIEIDITEVPDELVSLLKKK